MVKARQIDGWSLTELMIASAILGVLVMGIGRLISTPSKMSKLFKTQVEIERDGRLAANLVLSRLRNAQSNTVVVDAVAGQPPASRVQFTTQGGEAVAIWQEGAELKLSQGGRVRTMLATLQLLTFLYPDFADARTMKVTISLGKEAWGGERFERLRTETVKIMN